ncbi:MAG: hypothetical protein ABIG44_12590 [Planctomycetota bacterium]
MDEFRRFSIRMAAGALLSVMLLISSSFGQVAGSGLTIDDLLALAAARRERLVTLQLAFTADQEPPAGGRFARTYIPSISRTILIDLDTGWYSSSGLWS